LKPAALDAQQLSLDFDAPARQIRPPAATPSAPRRAEGLRRIALGADALDYRLRRARRRTIGFQIDDAGLTVSAPRWVTLREIEAAIAEKHRWIRSKLVEWREWRSKRRLDEVRFVDGGTLPYLGGRLVLRLHGDGDTRPHLRADLRAVLRPDLHELHLALAPNATEQQVRDTVQAWLQGEARRILGERLAQLAAPLAVRPRGWTLSSARSQWGSCTHDGRIRLNWRLVHFSLPVIDYVVAHELAHLTEMNHGARFWETVGQLLPGFEPARDEIRAVDLASLPV
jgi:predicted metal-dependent hydrolase